MRSFSVLFVLGWFLFLCATTAMSASTVVQGRPLEPVSLQLKWFHQFQFAGYYAAEFLGYYANEGLEVDIREMDPTKDSVAQVLEGEATYGIGDAGIIVKYANGSPIIALAAIFQHNPLVFISLQSSGIISPYEMAGKRIMYSASGNDDSPLQAMLLEAGLGREDYRYIPQSFDSADLAQGKVDVMSAYLTNEPFFFKQQGIALNIINPQNYGIDFYGDLLFTSQRELSEHPGRAERFRRASLRGWRYALDHPDEVIRILRTRYASQLSVAHLRFEAAEIRKLILPDTIPLGRIEVARLRRVSEVYARQQMSGPMSDRQLQGFVYGNPNALELSPAEQAWLANHPVIRLGIDREFAPYEWIDKHGNYVGLVADYMKLLQNRLGVRFEVIRDKPWAEILEMAKRGELDMIGAAVKTPERETFLNFTRPYVSNPAVIINDERYGYIGSLDRLRGKRVAVEEGYFVQELLAHEYPEIDLVSANDVEHALTLVVRGSADAYVGDAVSASFAIKKAGLMNLRFSGQTRYQSESSVAVSKDHPELLSIVEKAMANIPQADKNAILDRWMGLKIETGIGTDTVIRYGTILFGLFLLFVYWLVRLFREVKARKQSEARLTSLYTSMTIGFALYEVIRDPAGKVVDYRFLEVNPAFESLTGLGRDCWAEHTLTEVLPESEHYWIEYFSDAASSGESAYFENYSVILGRWFFTYGYSPQPEQFAVLLRDITDSKRSERREQARNEVLEQLAHDAPLSVILESIVRSVESENPGMLCSILLVDDDEKQFRVGAAPNLPESYRNETFSFERDLGSCSNCLLNVRTVECSDTIPDAAQHPTCSHRAMIRKAGYRSCWSEPIRFASGKLVGIFVIYHRKPRIPGKEEISLIEHAANLAAVAIDRSRSNEALRLAHMVYQNSTEAMMVIDADTRIIAINPAFNKITGFTLEEVFGRSPRMLESAHKSADSYREMREALTTVGHWQGEVWKRRKNGQEFTAWLRVNTIRAEDGAVERRVALFSDITEKKQADELIQTQANYDALTHLPNRRLFTDRLEQEIRKAQRDKRLFALLFLDLDSFKEVNDTLGHQMGDELLVEASKRICGCVRESDTVARLGGDEFTIVLSELGNVSDIDRVAQCVIETLSRPFHLGEDRVYVSASVGITVYPDDATTVKGLLQNADQAMYAAKNEGRGRCSYFTPSMQVAAKKRVLLARDLRNALRDDQFQVYYQPVVELKSGTVRKAEALLRWCHPRQGFISPAEFIPIAEDTGTIHEIGDWVFRTAAKQAQRWVSVYGGDFQVSVNKSPAQFHADNRTQDRWIEYLRKIGLDGANIVIEITEGLLLNAERGVIDKLLDFRDRGIQVAIDDFGTGYSSLAYLKKFSIDYLKIDQSFTRNLIADSEDMALCEAVVIMAHKLGLKVIAEGVETRQQCDLLRGIGCDYGQGYLFAGPLTSEDFERMLEDPAENTPLDDNPSHRNRPSERRSTPGEGPENSGRS